MNIDFKCGDSNKVLKTINDSSVRLVVSSPPYSLGKEYETKQPLDEYLNNIKSIIYEINRILVDGGSVCWQVGNYVNSGEIFPLDIFYYHIFYDLGFKLRNRIIWKFEHGLHCQHRLSGRYETVLWMTKGDNYIFNLDSIRVPQKYPNKKYFKGPKKGELSCNPLGKNPGDVWDIPNIKNNHIEKTEHPCQFPCELCERLILSLSNPGELICDPFCGSGTSGIASLIHNRKFIGIDKEQKYIDISIKRLDKFKKGEVKVREWGFNKT